jgi:small subunit ribosomal protein S1
MSSDTTENNSSEIDKTSLKGENAENFADMLDQNIVEQRLSPGQKVRTKVISISGDLVYIDLGRKNDGVVDLAEFIDDNGEVSVHAGDEIEAFFVTFDEGLMKMTTLINGYSAATLHSIRDAFEGEVSVNGEVKREIKGGFEVSLGGVRCFCPFSQIDLKNIREANGYIGQTFPFKVLEYEQEGKKIVLSRRVLLEKEKQLQIEKLKESLTVGMEVSGEVKSIQNFGVFVDLGGVDGLIPVSETSWDRSVNPGDILSIGQHITAKILSLDWESTRLTLSLKALQPDPWITVAEKYPVGSRVDGAIVRLAPFGAFVVLEPGVEGLIHISNLGTGRRINHPKEIVETGQWVETYVLSLDQEKRRISLSMQPKVEPIKIVLPAVGEILDGVVEKVMPYGIFLKMNNGLTGLIPNSEMGTSQGTDHRRMFNPGTEMQVMVIDVDVAEKKVRLSRKALLEKAAQDEYTEYIESQKTSLGSHKNFGTIGDILKSKLKEKKNEN